MLRTFWLGLSFQKVGMSFFMTMYMLYLTRDLGLSYGMAMSLNIVYMGLSVPLEICTAWLGDRFGHRNSVVIGLFVEAISCIVYALATNYTHAFIAESLYAIGYTCISGSDRACLGKGLPREVFVPRWSRHLAICKVLSMMGSMIGAWIGFQVDFRLVFILSAGVIFIGAILVLITPIRSHSPISQLHLPKIEYGAFVASLLKTHRRFLLKAFCSSVFVRALFGLWPIVLADFGDQWVIVTGSLISVGMAIGFQLVRVSTDRDYSHLQSCKGVLLCLMVWSVYQSNPLGFVIGLFLWEILHGGEVTYWDTVVHSKDSDWQASAHSYLSMILSVGGVIGQLSGFLADIIGPLSVLVVSGIGYIIISIL